MSGSSNAGPETERLALLREALGGVVGQAEPLDAFAASMFLRHRSVLRLRHGLSPEQISFALRPIAWYPLAFRVVEEAIRPSATLEYAGGDFYLQDAGSLLALAAADADAPGRRDRLICDLCAAPGGKATALLESIGDGFLLANEPIKSRLPALQYNLARTGSDRYAVSNLDPDALAGQLPGVFDLVLVDAPCSGQALLGKGKQRLSAVSMTQIRHSGQRARRILAAAVELLRPGGELVFSTCTFAEEENEAQVRWLCREAGLVAAPLARLAEHASDELGCYRLWPHRDDCAGSFAASLRKPQAEQEIADPAQPKRRRSNVLPTRELQRWFERLPERQTLAGAVVWGWPDDAPQWVEAIACGGPELAYRTGQTWKPGHAAALRRGGSNLGPPTVAVDDEAARRYWCGHPIACGSAGWCVVVHRGRPLGWVKASGGTGKNHLPTAARRIR